MNPKTLLAVFMLGSLAGMFFVSAAYAYPTNQPGIPLPFPNTGTSSFSFNVGTSFQNLFLPFETFFGNLANSIGNQAVVGPSSGAPPAPVFNLQNINPETFTNVSLSEILKVILNGILWVLGLTQQFIQWLLGQVH